jgi:undecaprenyl phosphate-alpha-L-ara4N flippase subunit ArnE
MIERLPGFLLILGSVVTEGLGHIAFKRAADFGRHGRSVLSVLQLALKRYKLIASGMACFVLEGLCWTFALKTLDVSLAYPIGSLELVVITVLCVVLLKEQVGFRRWVGVALIVGGTLLVGTS